MHIFRSRILVAMGLGAQAVLGTSCGSTSSGDTKGGTSESMSATSEASGAGGTAQGQGGGASTTSAETTAGGASASTGASSTNGADTGGTAGQGQGGSAGTGAGGATAAGGSGGSGAGGTSSTEFCQPWPSCATVRRPFLVGADMRFARAEAREDWLTPHLGEVDVPHARTREVLAEVWLKDALEEHASVAAFARFTMLLLSVGAPADLVVLSQRASLEEVKHARDCFALARRYGSSTAGPGALDVTGAVHMLSLAQLVELTVEEGCVGETLGALLAKEQRMLAKDAEVARALLRIERDEARHAELAWRFLAWAIEQDAPGVRDAAERAFARAAQAIAAMPVVDYGVDLELWHAHGRVTCQEARELSQRALGEVVGPCWQALRASADAKSLRQASPGTAQANPAVC